jgi:ribosomal-protein-alanine N-acetyltransferase
MPLFRVRSMRMAEASQFAWWESRERPYPWSARQFLEAAVSSPSRVLVMEGPGNAIESEIKAYAVVQVVPPEAYLYNLMVVSNCRRQGWGRRMMEAVVSWVRGNGATSMILDVDPANAAAMKLYEGAGFKVLERRRGAYPRGEDALTMEIKI